MTYSSNFGLARRQLLGYHACGAVAQWLEQGTHNPLVVGSNPPGPSFSASLTFSSTPVFGREEADLGGRVNVRI